MISSVIVSLLSRVARLVELAALHITEGRMLLMLAIYGVAAAAAPWLVGRLGTRAFVVLSVVPAAVFVGILTTSSDARDGMPYTESMTWIPGLDVDLSFAWTPCRGRCRRSSPVSARWCCFTAGATSATTSRVSAGSRPR